jgi:integrase
VTVGRALSHDVRIWSIARRKGARGTSYVVRWVVAGGKSQQTFTTLKLAEGFRTQLQVAARNGDPFDIESGLPSSLLSVGRSRTWYEHAVEYASVKWPAASPKHRKGIAEALTAVTIAVTLDRTGWADEASLRQALNRWSFQGGTKPPEPPDEFFAAVAWLRRNSPPLSALAQPALLRQALDALALTLDGRPAASSTTARKRATFHNALEYAVELELFEANPLQRIRWKRAQPSDEVDRRVVVNPTQARQLIDVVWGADPAVAGFLACLYFAGMRPAEARNLRLRDCLLPEVGWGELVLTGSHQEAGAAWTDSGRGGEERALKHRRPGQTRRVPAHPELVAILQRHLDRFGTGADGRLFVARTGKAGAPLSPPYLNPVPMDTVYRALRRARSTVFDGEQVSSPLARRPYDLRHACLSTWLNAGVSPAQVADWAGHSVQVLLRVYAGCVDGQEELARQRIEAALRV